MSIFDFIRQRAWAPSGLDLASLSAAPHTIVNFSPNTTFTAFQQRSNLPQIFRFFDLPPELRIIVYKELCHDRLTVIPGVRQSLPSEPLRWGVVDAAVMEYPDPSLLRINKQFSSELERVVFNKAELCVGVALDRKTALQSCSLPSSRFLTVPAYVIANLRHLELEVMVWPTRFGARHETKVDLLRFCQLPTLRRLQIRVCVDLSLFPEFAADDEDLASRTKVVRMLHRLYARTEGMQRVTSELLPTTKVDVGLYIQTRLYQTHPHVLRFGVSHRSMQDILKALDSSDENFVCYRARPSTGILENSYHGMDLELDTTEGVGYFDVEKYERLVREALAAKSVRATTGGIKL